MTKPDFVTMWTNFARINVSVKEVGKKIGGKVQYNIDQGIFQNACAIRMSYALNYSGVPVSRSPRWATSSGADKKWYIFKVADLIDFLESALGAPDMTAKSKKEMEAFQGKKGLVVFNVSWEDATGHATLWDGSGCSDTCYYQSASEAKLWILS
ncbi:type VI secretion system amidase effector protein Tae4 [Morganella morganii]|uniref:type VI secretion system amidase effector protein Tae4 n=1 Tax=Morganella morganii TaxID=582 RepID=UPI0018977E0B|nr:type VI secretion system amidase effector protein Tae4 [Morganella morganii]